MVVVVVGIIEWHCDDLLVILTIVQHGNHADGIGPHQCQRLHRLRTQQKHVQWIPVISVGTGDKAIIGRVVSGGM